MAYENNFDLFQLFIIKDITVWNKENSQENFIIHAPSIKEFYTNNNLTIFINLLNASQKELKSINPFLKGSIAFKDFLYSCFFELGLYKEFWDFNKNIEDGFKTLIPSLIVDKKQKKIFIKGNLELTNDICNSIQEVVKLICGDNRETVKPTSKESSDFYEAQKEQEAKIAALRRKTNSEKNKDGLLKTFLFIEYKFPNYTHEYLLNQTMAQIQWLQKYAAGAVSYEVNAEVFAAGNMKKGSKLDFFIK